MEMEYEIDNRDLSTTWLWVKKDGKKIGYIDVNIKELVQNALENDPCKPGTVKSIELLHLGATTYMDYEGFSEGNVADIACKTAYKAMVESDDNLSEKQKDVIWNMLTHIVYEVEDAGTGDDHEYINEYAMAVVHALVTVATIWEFVGCNQPRPDQE